MIVQYWTKSTQTDAFDLWLDFLSLTKQIFWTIFIFFLARDGCAGTANYRIAGTSSHLHIMWSSPNNFDKHASHLAVGGYHPSNPPAHSYYFSYSRNISVLHEWCTFLWIRQPSCSILVLANLDTFHLASAKLSPLSPHLPDLTPDKNSSIYLRSHIFRSHHREVRQIQRHVLPETNLVREKVHVSRQTGHLVFLPRAYHPCQDNHAVRKLTDKS